MQGYDGNPKKYIASMGPKDVSLVNFWRMVWDCKVHAIVMTTNTVEKGRAKCEVYWHVAHTVP